MPNNKPIFILGCTKSGTSLLRNLLDGHPNLFVIPAETHFFQNIGIWVSYFFRKTAPKKQMIDEMKLSLINWLEISNTKTNELADGFSKGKWNIEIFEQNIRSKEVTSTKELFDLFVESLYLALYGETYKNQLRFVEKSVENTEFALDYLKLYPEAKFIHIIRNPYSNLVALRKFKKKAKEQNLKGNSYPLFSAFNSMYQSYYALYRNQRLLNKEQYFVLKYEDLLNFPKENMTAIAQFLNIQYQDSLLQPTLIGRLWGGNSTNDVKFKNISNKNIDKWKDEITDFEIHSINSLFNHILEDFEYEKIKPKHGINRLTRKEGIMTYLINRLMFKFLPLSKPHKNINNK